MSAKPLCLLCTRLTVLVDFYRLPRHLHIRMQLSFVPKTSIYLQNLIFNNKFQFVLGTDNNNVRVSKRPIEVHQRCRAASCSIAGVTVWVPQAMINCSLLIAARGSLTGQWYVDDIL